MLYRWLHSADLRNEAIAPPVERFDAVLRPPTVTNGLARRHNAVVQRHLTDKLVGPELFQELVLRDHPLTMLDEVEQDVKHLRFELTRLASVTQLIQAGVEFVLRKDVAHRLSSSASGGLPVSSTLPRPGARGSASPGHHISLRAPLSSLRTVAPTKSPGNLNTISTASSSFSPL